MVKSKMEERIRDHIVICNWSAQAEFVLQELRSSVLKERRPVIIVSATPDDIPRNLAPYFDLVFVVPGDPMDEQVLRRTNVREANTAIVLADSREGSYADMKSILIALAIEAIEPRVYTVVELLQTRNRAYFEHTHVDEIVCSAELMEKLLSQSVITHGASLIFQHLLTATEDTNELYKIPVPPAFLRRTYRELEARILNDDTLEVILLGLVTKDTKERSGQKLRNHEGHEIEVEQLTLNPRSPGSKSTHAIDRNYALQAGDTLIVMAYEYPESLQFLDFKEKKNKKKARKLISLEEDQ
ncbi:MAG: NAD-binding protein [bacterium]